MTNQNIFEIQSYYDLPFNEREKLLIAISKPKSFFNTFFNNLKNARNRIECFNKINDLHVEVYGYEMYSSYQSFIITYRKYLNKKKK